MKNISLLHYVHEATLGGASVHVAQLLRDSKNLGCKVGYATLQNGVIGEELEKEGIPVLLMEKQEDLINVAEDFGANVLHGHTCGGGSYACSVGKQLGIVAGETIHSYVPRTGEMEGDFEIVELTCLQQIRPGSNLIRWAMYNEDKFRITKSRKEIREELGIPQGAYLIGRNGRLDGAKAPDEFVRCLGILTKVSNMFWGLMVGDGPIYDNLRNLAEQHGCSKNLIMPGTRRDQGNLFNAMDCVVYPTYDESVCAGVVEPLFLKKPVVCYPVGGMSETIINGRTGFHARTVEDLADAVVWFVSNPEEAKKFGESGYKHVINQGHMDHIEEARKHISVYQWLLDRRT